jgi:hypothetical protein
MRDSVRLCAGCAAAFEPRNGERLLHRFCPPCKAVRERQQERFTAQRPRPDRSKRYVRATELSGIRVAIMRAARAEAQRTFRFVDEVLADWWQAAGEGGA